MTWPQGFIQVAIPPNPAALFSVGKDVSEPERVARVYCRPTTAGQGASSRSCRGCSAKNTTPQAQRHGSAHQPGAVLQPCGQGCVPPGAAVSQAAGRPQAQNSLHWDRDCLRASSPHSQLYPSSMMKCLSQNAEVLVAWDAGIAVQYTEAAGWVRWAGTSGCYTAG